MKKVALFIVFAFLTMQAFAQANPVALKFDEFRINELEGYYPYTRIDIAKRIERLRPLARSRRSDSFFVIYYSARMSNESSYRILENWASQAKNKLIYEWNVDEKRVVALNGGYRDEDTIEFWVVPKGADAPVETPSYQKSETFFCPRIDISGIDSNFDSNRPASFTVSTAPKQDGLKYRWSVSAGNIVTGVEDDSVEIDPKGNKKITVFVEVSGLPLPCKRVAFRDFSFGKRAYLLDDLDRFNSSQYSAVVDGLMIELNNEPEMSGYIITYAGRSKGIDGAKRLFAEAKRPFIFRKYDLNRVRIVEGGYREFDSVELWLLPPGAEPPKATPTVDNELVQFLKKKPRHR